MDIQCLWPEFAVCRLPSIDGVDFSGEFVFLSKTDDEISLVCETGHAPPGVTASEPGWRALRVAGVLDFALIGVIARITGLLAEVGISVFVVSTYDTDYVFMKAEYYGRGIQVLTDNGYVIT